jgi:hypothetical protein
MIAHAIGHFTFDGNLDNPIDNGFAPEISAHGDVYFDGLGNLLLSTGGIGFSFDLNPITTSQGCR